ncbi:MAG: hypothetical protein HRT45_09070 [Bdellovibrionales bacterium]|nr:hypothetical protein [Bdellovibrionales bacterium]
MEPVFVVNTESRGGQGHLGQKIAEPIMAEQLLLWSPTTDKQSLQERVQSFVQNGARDFVACGGDGTVNALTESLFQSGYPTHKFRLGAVALGSSNDFHKSRQSQRNRFPGLLNFKNTAKQEVLEIEIDDKKLVYANLNASIGLTAEANSTFNQLGWLGKKMKSWSLNLAIGYSILMTLLRLKPLTVQIETDHEKLNCQTLNTQIIKQRFFAGDLSYPKSAETGKIDLYIYNNITYLSLFSGLVSLAKGELPRTKALISKSTRQLTITSEKPIALERDGEVVTGCKFKIRVSPQELNVCQELASPSLKP